MNITETMAQNSARDGERMSEWERERECGTALPTYYYSYNESAVSSYEHSNWSIRRKNV